jgi:flavorubredoxin
MPSVTLYDDGTHRNVLLEDFGHGEAVQANQHVILQGNEGAILDPGGHKVYTKAMSETMSILGQGSSRSSSSRTRTRTSSPPPTAG